MSGIPALRGKVRKVPVSEAEEGPRVSAENRVSAARYLALARGVRAAGATQVENPSASLEEVAEPSRQSEAIRIRAQEAG